MMSIGRSSSYTFKLVFQRTTSDANEHEEERMNSQDELGIPS